MAKKKEWNNWVELEGFDINGHFGFIYLIRNLETGEWYVGAKQFWRRVKGKTVEADWRRYQSSNDTVKSWDRAICHFEVLEVVDTKYELSHQEIFWLMKLDALRRVDCLNYMMGSNTIGRCPKTFQIKAAD